MNIKVYTVGGGTFSKFMVAIQCILSNINNVNKINNIYIDIDRKRICRIRHKNISENPFNYVLDQKDIGGKNLNVLHASPSGVYQDIINHKDLNKLRIICSKIKIKKSIINMVNPKIDPDTIGVHVRLTDMDQVHPIYGKSTTQKYITKINNVLDNKKRKIFVASDNDNSIKIIKKNFNIMFNNVSNRHKNETGNGYMEYLRSRSVDEQLWVDSFLEMLSLSRCGELIYKISSLSITSIIFSKTIKKTYKP
tara:strand:- start:4112 stop:4864 length:753 start_codon:yes stop_codon:yes gene_type:complete